MYHLNPPGGQGDGRETRPAPMRFQRSVRGFNLTNKGISSFSKTLRMGPLNVNLNASRRGVAVSLGLPGTGLSTDLIPLLSFNGSQRRSTRSRNR